MSVTRRVTKVVKDKDIRHDHRFLFDRTKDYVIIYGNKFGRGAVRMFENKVLLTTKKTSPGL